MPDSNPTPRGADPGESMNVREVHGAILREKSLPGELMRRVPWYLHLLYFTLIMWAYFYLANYSAGFRWDEYEYRPGERAKRELLERQAEANARRIAPPPRSHELLLP